MAGYAYLFVHWCLGLVGEVWFRWKGSVSRECDHVFCQVGVELRVVVLGRV